MATFSGTTQKCKACAKTVYWVEELTADNKVYHKSCFRCHHCKGTLKLSNYSSFEGALYCKPHFDQLYKLTGSLDKSFAGAPKTIRIDRSVDQGYTNNKVSSLFGGTQEKCVTCKKTVYPIEKVTVDGTPYHKNCFRCTHGGCVITPSNYVAHEQKLYCRHHHRQLFKQTGNFSQFNKNEQAKRKTENGNTASESNANWVTDNTKHKPSANGTTDNTKQESSTNGTNEDAKQELPDANGKIENTEQESYANGSASQPEA